MTDRFVHISGDVGAESIIVKQQRQEIAQLKEAIRRLADQDATLSVQSGNVTVTMDATITDEERRAIEWCIEQWAGINRSTTLRKLLERMK
jgi:hypothetical protein